MSEFNFKSQPATSIEQSIKLLALGLKKETADCVLPKKDNLPPLVMPYDKASIYTTLEIIPAWSLDRLRELIPENIFTGVRNQWHRVMYNGILTYEEGDDSLVSFMEANIYDRCVSCIEWQIKEGYFNKEFLV